MTKRKTKAKPKAKPVKKVQKVQGDFCCDVDYQDYLDSLPKKKKASKKK